MAFCTKCGSELQEGVNFCTNCGTPVEDTQFAGGNQAASQLQQQVVYVKRKAQTKEEKDDYKKYLQYSAELQTAESSYGNYDAILKKYGEASNSLQAATERRDAFLQRNKNSSDETMKKLSKKAGLGGVEIAGFVIMIIGVIMLFNACGRTASDSLTGGGWFFTLLGIGLLAIGFYRSDKASKALRAYDTEFDELESEIEKYTGEKNKLQPLVDKISFVKNYENAHSGVTGL